MLQPRRHVGGRHSQQEHARIEEGAAHEPRSHPQLVCLLPQRQPRPEARDAGRERCFVVSGADQAELVDVFADKGLTGLFAGVYGSPTPKLELVSNVLEALGCAPADALLIGDGAGDFRVCAALNMRFVYLAQYSEWRGAREALQGAPRVAWANNWDELLRAFGV